MANIYQGFNLVNTKNNMNIKLILNKVKGLYGSVRIVNSSGSDVFEIKDITVFEKDHEEIMPKTVAKEKWHHVNIESLNDIYANIKKIEKSEQSRDDKILSASSHAEVVENMTDYLNVIRDAFSELYYYNEYNNMYMSFYNALIYDALTYNPFDFNKSIIKLSPCFSAISKTEVFGIARDLLTGSLNDFRTLLTSIPSSIRYLIISYGRLFFTATYNPFIYFRF
jgi:hypothetical protein